MTPIEKHQDMIILTDSNLTGYVRITSFIIIRHWLLPQLWHNWKTN